MLWLSKCTLTHLTGVRTFTCVTTHVIRQVTKLQELCIADITWVRPMSTVTPHMYLHRRWAWQSLPTNTAFQPLICQTTPADKYNERTVKFLTLKYSRISCNFHKIISWIFFYKFDNLFLNNFDAVLLIFSVKSTNYVISYKWIKTVWFS